ncbi:MAG: YsnF/AvaK domain-containing protein [Candidatus Velthaea sp.]
MGTRGDADDSAGTALAAIFSDREQAHSAAQRLHDEGFRDTWIGVTKTSDDAGDSSFTGGASGAMSETTVEAENWFQRFFGEGDQTLHDALVRHGVDEADAMNAGQVPPGSAILTVDGANHPEQAAQVIAKCGGRLITSGASATGFVDDVDDETLASAPAAASGSTASDAGLDYSDYGRYRGGAQLDEERRLQLREERINIDKQRMQSGEATIGKNVVTQQQSVDVPVVHEELFVERRPVSGDRATSASGTIGEGETIRVPLSEERVNVTKTPVVTDEVVIGKRQVTETQHVSETTRREELNVNDGGTTRSGGTSSGSDTTTANDIGKGL